MMNGSCKGGAYDSGTARMQCRGIKRNVDLEFTALIISRLRRICVSGRRRVSSVVSKRNASKVIGTGGRMVPKQRSK